MNTSGVKIRSVLKKTHDILFNKVENVKLLFSFKVSQAPTFSFGLFFFFFFFWPSLFDIGNYFRLKVKTNFFFLRTSAAVSTSFCNM